MIADYNFYTTVFLGETIPEDKFDFFGERASDKLARYEKAIPRNPSAQLALQKCACAIAELLYENKQAKKNGKEVSSESVNGYYTVSYATANENTIKKEVNGIIVDYLGIYLSMRPVGVIY